MANEISAEKLHSLGIKFDVLLSEKPSADLQDNLKVVPVENDALNKGLKFLIDEKYPAANIITDKNSIDSFLSFAEQITLAIYGKNRKIYPVRSGFEKWKPAGELIEIIGPSKDLEQKGLKQLNENQYQTIKDGFFRLKFSQPFLFISEEI